MTAPHTLSNPGKKNSDFSLKKTSRDIKKFYCIAFISTPVLGQVFDSIQKHINML